MKTTIFMPKKINVGFQERQGTYTGKLAYIIYFDDKGKLRKETSWNSWRDKEIDNQIFENTPTEGFVLNKKTGGYSTGWNHRQTYVRVYDPRGFEFEITIPNLLYILENTNSIKGKGLEGEFVYGWDGKDLILIPCDSPDYKEISSFNDKVRNKTKLKGKDFKVGGTYLSKNNSELVYLGRFDEWKFVWRRDNQSTYETKKKSYFFADKKTYSIITIGTPSQIIEVISEDCVENYAELVEKLEHSTSYSPIDNKKTQYLPYTLEEFLKRNQSYCGNFYTSDGKIINFNKTYSTKDREEKGVCYTRVSTEIPKIGYWKEYQHEDTYYKSLEEAFEVLKPHRKQIHLANGNIHERDAW